MRIPGIEPAPVLLVTQNSRRLTHLPSALIINHQSIFVSQPSTPAFSNSLEQGGKYLSRDGHQSAVERQQSSL
jgi:hypothetical protein